jgi:hypothetical protein
MFAKPTLADFQRNLDQLIHESENAARIARGKNISSFAARGLAISGSIVNVIASEFDTIHKQTVSNAASLAVEFVSQASIPISEISTAVKNRLTNFSIMILGQIPASGLDPSEWQQFAQRWTAKWNQRTDGALKDLDVGIVSGHFISATNKDVQPVSPLQTTKIQTHEPPVPIMTARDETPQWDVFISHASEDKDDFVRPLAELLQTHGLKVWYDEFTMQIGDRLHRSIEIGLANSRFGVVVLSPHFLKKEWPQRELDGLVAREINRTKVILPVWHQLGRDELLACSPILADRLAVSSRDGVEKVANELLKAIQGDSGGGVASVNKPEGELVAFGPNIVCVGEILSAARGEWCIRLDEFVVGEIGSLVRYAEKFEEIKSLNRYVIVNALGDGRALTGPLLVYKEAAHHIVKCPVAASFPRKSAKDLGSQMAISSETNDLFIQDGGIARTSGVDSLRQVLQQTLSLVQGEAFFARDRGSRLQEYFWRYRDTRLLLSMLKLDIIRLAAIPYQDGGTKHKCTPLQCIERVWSMKLLATEPNNDRIPMLLDLEINGIGRAEYEVSVFIPPVETLKKIGLNS